jgi:hypothetical protein
VLFSKHLFQPRCLFFGNLHIHERGPVLGTHQGAIGHHHLDDYLDEFTFRFNRRTSASRGKLFYRLAQQAVQVDSAPFATLIKPQRVAFGGVK